MRKSSVSMAFVLAVIPVLMVGSGSATAQHVEGACVNGANWGAYDESFGYGGCGSNEGEFILSCRASAALWSGQLAIGDPDLSHGQAVDVFIAVDGEEFGPFPGLGGANEMIGGTTLTFTVPTGSPLLAALSSGTTAIARQGNASLDMHLTGSSAAIASSMRHCGLS